MPSFPCPVAANARKMPESIALSWGRRSITWDMLSNYVHSTSRYLKEISVRRGQSVVLLKEDSPSTPIVLLALWRIGAAVCCIDPGPPFMPAAVLAAHIKPDLVIGLRSLRKTWPKECRWADIEQVVAYGYNDAFLGGEASLDPMLETDLVVLRRCSAGSEGPVSVPLTYAQLKDDPRDLSGLISALTIGETFIIS